MLTGPMPATRKALAKAGLTIDDIDLFEVNEAFAAVPMRFMKEMGVPHEKVNVNGGAIAMGHSVYVPGRVEPMLPEALSNGACSLRPDEDRNAVTVEIDLRGTTVERTAFYRSPIRSNKRLDYDQVDRIFAGREGAGAVGGAAHSRREASAELQAERERGGALAIESSEPDFASTRRAT